jgi:heat shock protein HslJ
MRHRALLILAALAAPAAIPAAAQAQGGSTYRALGTEPFWSVTINGGRMVYDDAQGRKVAVRTPAARPSFNGRRYVSRRLTVDITRQPCSDGMSDFTYADTVRVTVDGRSLQGCGGATLPPASLANTSWEIVSIDGERVAGGEQYQLSFSDTQLSGRAGCNSFSGGYRVGRDGFQAGPLAMTRMACPGPRMQHEQAVARILAGRVRLYYPDGRTLVMRGVTGGEIRLRRAG